MPILVWNDLIIHLLQISPRVAVCCGALQCVAMGCSVLQCVAVCCSVLQCAKYINVANTNVHQRQHL